ncbi:MAG: nitrophenyl compound nitroreductase subunit ArsF family protein, partial [Planctomycetota bacterium]
AETNTEQIIPSSIAKTQTEDIQQDNQLIVYYFHGDQRCATCHKLETYAKEALDTYFADKIASKKIVWKVVNVDRTENSHFIQDYKLVTKSVVLSEVAHGKEVGWKNLDQIWQKVGNKESYLQYVCDSIWNFLENTDS